MTKDWDRLDFLALMAQIEAQPEKPHIQRIERILELLGNVRNGMTTSQMRLTLPQLRNALRRYKWVFHISNSSEGLRVMTLPAYDLFPEPTEERVVRLRTGEVFSRGPGDDIWEQQTVRGLLDGMNFGERPRTRRCEYCSEWFFAETPPQRFHSVACRQKAHYAKPEKRESKKQYMQKRYETMKSDAKKELEEAERKERARLESTRIRRQARDLAYEALRKKPGGARK